MCALYLNANGFSSVSYETHCLELDAYAMWCEDDALYTCQTAAVKGLSCCQHCCVHVSQPCKCKMVHATDPSSLYVCSSNQQEVNSKLTIQSIERCAISGYRDVNNSTRIIMLGYRIRKTMKGCDYSKMMLSFTRRQFSKTTSSTITVVIIITSGRVRMFEGPV